LIRASVALTLADRCVLIALTKLHTVAPKSADLGEKFSQGDSSREFFAFFFACSREGGGKPVCQKKYLTLEEVAILLGRTPKSIYHMVERGLLPYRKLGRRVVFLQAELDEFIEALPGLRPADVRKRWRL
jgi:excisionase family DNA binding protein